MSKRSKAFFSSMTIARKITILYGGIFSLSLLAISFFVLLNVTAIEQSNVKEELIKTVENIDDYIQQGNALSEEALETLLENKYVEVSIIDGKNHKVYKNSVGEVPSFIRQPQPAPEQNMDKQSWQWEIDLSSRPEDLEKKGFKVNMERIFNVDNKEYFITSRDGSEFVMIEKKIYSDDNHYLVQAFKMLPNNHYYFQSFGLRLLLIDVLGIFLSFLIGRYISKKMLKPVEEIQQTAERISIEDLSRRIDTEGPDDEMKELAETFNSMISRLESSFQKQNQFL